MKRIALAAVTACITAALVVPASSQAVWSQTYCGFVMNPGSGSCSSGGPHSLDRANSWYGGAAAHHVKTCTYLWNSVEGRFRGGLMPCQWSDVGDGVARVSFGPTTAAQYYGRALNHSDTCCPHTIWGWTRTTY